MTMIIMMGRQKHFQIGKNTERNHNNISTYLRLRHEAMDEL